MKKTTLSIISVTIYALGLCAVLFGLFSTFYSYAVFANGYYDANTKGATIPAVKPIVNSDKMELRKVKFSLYKPQAKEVCLNADFNLWGKHKIVLERDSKGEFSGMFILPQGDYKYFFTADDEPILDAKNKQHVPCHTGDASLKTVL